MRARSAQPADFLQVKGLSKVDDILLKWLAEYTRRRPNEVDGFSAYAKEVWSCAGLSNRNPYLQKSSNC